MNNFTPLILEFIQISSCLPEYKTLFYNNLRAYKAHSTQVENIRQNKLFLQNKPNLLEGKNNTNSLYAKNYEISTALRDEKTNPIQTQFKADSKPIKPKANPIQTQSNPIDERSKNEPKSLQNNELWS